MFKLVQRANWSNLRRLRTTKTSSNFLSTNANVAAGELAFSRHLFTSRPLKVMKVHHHASTQEQKNLSVVPVNYELNRERRFLQLTWSSGECSLHPVTWLRDNCRCSKCFNSSTLSRKILLQSFDVHPEIKTVELNVGNHGDVLVSWTDGHTSQWTRDFLLARSFTASRQNRRQQCYKSAPKLWGKELMETGVPTHDYQTILNEPKALLAWLEDIEVVGLTLINGIPPEHEALKKLLQIVAYPESNNYGYYFDVKSKTNPSNLAYTSNTLEMHLDLPYYKIPPGIQLLQYVYQSDDVVGGENEFSDGFHCANKLKECCPRSYNILTKTWIDFANYGTDFLPDFHLIQQKHIIDTDNEGNVVLINFSNQVRDSYLNIPADEVQPYYESMKLFYDLLHQNRITMRGQTGQLVAFDNHRVLHGRLSFQCKDGVERYLRGAYLRWDETRSRMRRLRGQLRTGFEEDIP